MVITSEERKQKRLSVEDVRENGLVFRLIDSHTSMTKIIAYATSREELFDLIDEIVKEKGCNKCDLITQEYMSYCDRYGRNYYHTKPRNMFIIEDNKTKYITVNQTY